MGKIINFDSSTGEIVDSTFDQHSRDYLDDSEKKYPKNYLIEFEFADNSVVPLCIETPSNKLHSVLTGFLSTRYYHPHIVNKNWSRLQFTSMRSKIYQIRSVIESLSRNDIHYLNANWIEIEKIINLLCFEHISNDKYNEHVSVVREFYEYLDFLVTAGKLPFHNCYVPAKATRTRIMSDDESNNDFLNYTKDKTFTESVDPLHKSKSESPKHYCGKVLPHHLADKVFEELDKIDPVFKIMFKFGILTYARVANICEFPLRKDFYGNRFISYDEMKSRGMDKQAWTHILKGGKKHTFNIDIHVFNLIWNDYVNNNKLDVTWNKRKKLFENSWLNHPKSNFKFDPKSEEPNRRVPNDVLWLNKYGTPVKPYMFQDALKQVSKTLGFRFHPHMTRHTGITWTFEKLCKADGIHPSKALKGYFTEILRGLVGHASIQTTVKYINTLIQTNTINKIMIETPDFEDIDPLLKNIMSSVQYADVKEKWFEDFSSTS